MHTDSLAPKRARRRSLSALIRRSLAPAISRQEGDSLSEFAVVSVVLFMVVFGIIDCSRALYAYHFVSYAARDAARYAIVRGSTFTATCTTVSTFSCAASSTNVTSYVRAIVPGGITSGSVSVNATWPGTAPTGAATPCSTTSGNNSPGCLVTVQVSYPYTFNLPFIPQKAMTLSSTASMVIAQ